MFSQSFQLRPTNDFGLIGARERSENDECAPSTNLSATLFCSSHSSRCLRNGWPATLTSRDRLRVKRSRARVRRYVSHDAYETNERTSQRASAFLHSKTRASYSFSLSFSRLATNDARRRCLLSSRGWRGARPFCPSTSFSPIHEEYTRTRTRSKQSAPYRSVFPFVSARLRFPTNRPNFPLLFFSLSLSALPPSSLSLSLSHIHIHTSSCHYLQIKNRGGNGGVLIPAFYRSIPLFLLLHLKHRANAPVRVVS